MNSKNILLVEPGYPNKYPPLGLMKLAAYHGQFGRQERVRFVKGEDPEVMFEPWDPGLCDHALQLRMEAYC